MFTAPYVFHISRQRDLAPLKYWAGGMSAIPSVENRIVVVVDDDVIIIIVMLLLRWRLL